MPDEFAVKPGVVLPERESKGGGKPRYPFDDLTVGGIFFVPDKQTQYMSTYAASRGRELGKKFVTQKVHMRRDIDTEKWVPCKSGAPGARVGVAVTRTA